MKSIILKFSVFFNHFKRNRMELLRILGFFTRIILVIVQIKGLVNPDKTISLENTIHRTYLTMDANLCMK